MNKNILCTKTETLVDIVQQRRSELNAKVLKTFLGIAIPGAAIVFGLVYNAQKIGKHLIFLQKDDVSGVIQDNSMYVYIAALIITIVAAAMLRSSLFKIIRQSEGMLTQEDIQKPMVEILAEISTAPAFKRSDLISKDTLYTTGFLKNTNCLYFGNNLIEIPGFQNIQVRLCNLHALEHNPHYKSYENESRVISRNPIGVYFDGVLVQINLNKSLPGKTIIVPEIQKSSKIPDKVSNFINKNSLGNQPDYKSQFPQQHSVLDGQYKVYSSEPETAPELITEEFLEKTERLSKAIKAVKSKHQDIPEEMALVMGMPVAQLKISIVENSLFLGIERVRLFKLSVRKSYNETKQDIEESIRYYKAIVDFCKEIDV